MAHSFRDVPWFLRVEVSRFSFPDCTKPTMTRANIAAEHERGGAVRPAFENVRTTRFLTNRVQIESFDQLQHLVLIGWVAQADAEPFRLGLTDPLIVADYTKFAGQLITSGKILRALGSRRKRLQEQLTGAGVMSCCSCQLPLLLLQNLLQLVRIDVAAGKNHADAFHVRRELMAHHRRGCGRA